MPFTITVAENAQLPGAVNIVIQSTETLAHQYRVDRVDASAMLSQPVRNFSGIGAGSVTTPATDYGTDCEAPLGRTVTYNLVNLGPGTVGQILAQSGPVTCDAPLDGRSLLRSVLRPTVSWTWTEPMDQTGVEWGSSSTTHWIPGSDTPILVSEVRHRHKGVFVFLCKSWTEADQVVTLCRDGTLMLLRNSPCSGKFVRDTLFMPLDITEVLVRNSPGWRKIAVEFQSSKFIYGETDEPRFSQGWDFGVLNPPNDPNSLKDSAPDFATMAGLWPNFGVQALLPMPVWGSEEDMPEEERQRRKRILEGLGDGDAL